MNAHTTTQLKKPTGDGNPTAGHAHGAIVPRLCNRIKALAYWLAGIFGGRV